MSTPCKSDSDTTSKKVVPFKRTAGVSFNEESNDKEHAGVSQEFNNLPSIESVEEKNELLDHNNRDAKVEELYQFLRTYKKLYDVEKHDGLVSPEVFIPIALKYASKSAPTTQISSGIKSDCYSSLQYFIHCHAEICKDVSLSKKVKYLCWLAHYHSDLGRVAIVQDTTFQAALIKCNEESTKVIKDTLKYISTLVVNFLLEAYSE
jgi:hypothetical protein